MRGRRPIAIKYTSGLKNKIGLQRAPLLWLLFLSERAGPVLRLTSIVTSVGGSCERTVPTRPVN
jgi:hypothetical protein